MAVRVARMTMLSRLIATILLFFGAAVAAPAAVTVSFYSHDFGGQFPHTFITVKGTLDGTGQAVDANYGFTAKSAGPGVLFGSVTGLVSTVGAKYIAGSDKQFSVTVNDATYARIMATARRWRDLPQPSYSLGKRSCVHFVMELLTVVDVKYNPKTKFIKKPKSFLMEVKGLNSALK